MTSTAGSPSSQPRAPRPAVMPARQIRWYAMAARMWRRPPGLTTLAIRLLLLPAIPVALWLHEPYDWQTTFLSLLGILALVWLARRSARGSLSRSGRMGPVSTLKPMWHVRAFLGERMFFNRFVVPVPGNVSRPAALLIVGAIAGGLVAGFAGLTGSLPVLLTGLALCIAGQVIYLMLMARLYGRMQDADALYRAWHRPPLNDNGRGAQRPGEAA